MYDWYMKKLNEFIQVSRYCHHPVIEAHMVLARSATQEYLASGEPQPKQALDHVIRLTAEQAAIDGFDETAERLYAVAESLQEKTQISAEIVAVDFAKYDLHTA